MKKKILIFLGIVLSAIILISIFYFVDINLNKLVVKCTYKTNVLNTQNAEYYSIGFDEEIFFINLKNKTINDKNWIKNNNYKVAVIDKDYIDFTNNETNYLIDRNLGTFTSFGAKGVKHYTSTGECEKYNYKQKF